MFFFFFALCDHTFHCVLFVFSHFASSFNLLLLCLNSSCAPALCHAPIHQRGIVLRSVAHYPRVLPVLAGCPCVARPGSGTAAVRQRGVLTELNFSSQPSTEENKPRGEPLLLHRQLLPALLLKNAVRLSSCSLSVVLKAHGIQDSCLWVKKFTRISLTLIKSFRPQLIYFEHILAPNPLLHHSILQMSRV